MIKTSRVRRALAAVLGLTLAGSLTAAAGAGAASAADDHLNSDRLLTAHDVADAGWDDVSAFKLVTPDGLLAQCGVELPYWSPGFVALERRGFDVAPPYRSAAEVVIEFRSNAKARDYVDSYAFGVGAVCPDVFGEKRWDVRSSAPLELGKRVQYARTWKVRDTSGRSQSLSITLVRMYERVEILWLVGEGHDDPAKSIDLPQLTRRVVSRADG